MVQGLDRTLATLARGQGQPWQMSRGIQEMAVAGLSCWQRFKVWGMGVSPHSHLDLGLEHDEPSIKVWGFGSLDSHLAFGLEHDESAIIGAPQGQLCARVFLLVHGVNAHAGMGDLR